MKLQSSKGAYRNALSGHAFLGTLVACGILLGFVMGYAFMETADVMFFKNSVTTSFVFPDGEEVNNTNLPRQLAIVNKQETRIATGSPSVTPVASPSPNPSPVSSPSPSASSGTSAAKVWAGDTIHSVLTSGGNNYQNYQTRIFWSSYQLVRKMPGGDRLTGFTRILHAERPDFLMAEIPTFLASTQLMNGVDYPVKNRPLAIVQWLQSVSKNPGLVQGAWVVMLECDYVWFRPLQAPGDAYDPNVLSVQYEYDYIVPNAPDLATCISKFYGNGNRDIIPRSGPAPVMMRLGEWYKVAPSYMNVSLAIENDPVCRDKLGWVREMYAWDIAITLLPEVKMETSKTPKSLLIGQPPFEETRGNAALYHYTWGPYFYDTKQNKALVYKWEKREIQSLEEVLRPSLLPLPPPYRDGILLEFDAPLTPKRHEIIVDFINVMNDAIKNVPRIEQLPADATV